MGIAKRRGNQALEMEKHEAVLAKKREALNAIRDGDVSSLVPDAHAIQRGPVRPLPEGRRKKVKVKLTEEEKTMKEVEDDEDDGGGQGKKKNKKKKKKKEDKEHK